MDQGWMFWLGVTVWTPAQDGDFMPPTMVVWSDKPTQRWAARLVGWLEIGRLAIGCLVGSWLVAKGTSIIKSRWQSHQICHRVL